MVKRPSELAMLEFFQNHGCLADKRVIYLGNASDVIMGDEDKITWNSSTSVIKSLLYLDSTNHAPITLIANTMGGSVPDGWAIYDIIKGISSKVSFFGIGKVLSMGTIIMQACEKRLLTTNTVVMIHDGSEALEGDPKTIKAWVDFSEKDRFNSYQVYYERMKTTNPKITLKEIERLCDHDTVLTAKEAVNLGLADSVIEKLEWS